MGNRLSQGRLGHVQANGGAAKVQIFSHGQELAPQAQLNQRGASGSVQAVFHMPYILMTTE